MKKNENHNRKLTKNLPADDESAAAVLAVELGAVVSACDEHGGVVVPEAAFPDVMEDAKRLDDCFKCFRWPKR